MIRQAVILAAGKGKRMKDIDTPKPLLSLHGKPIVEHWIQNFLSSGIEDIILVITPKDEEVFKSKLGKYDLTYCFQNQQLGTGHALFCAKDCINDDLFLVAMGDDKIVHDLKKLMIGKPIICGYEVDDVSSFGCIKMENEKFDHIAEKTEKGRGLANAGLYVMPKDFFKIYDKIPEDEKTGEHFLTHAPKILKDELSHEFEVVKLDFWVGINTPSELDAANELETS
jgi:bifunctional UDP-N-acetylglucosamine pyrophosphorylase/glucosamine-1-phosphate N-acetyltransferase